jgi:methionyl aminopeptidase
MMIPKVNRRISGRHGRRSEGIGQQGNRTAALSVLLGLLLLASSSSSAAFLVPPEQGGGAAAALNAPSLHTSVRSSSSSSSTQLYHNNNQKKRTSGRAGSGFGSSTKGGGAGGGSAGAKSPPSSRTATFPYAGSVRPGTQSPQRLVLDESIVKPDYHRTGIPKSKGGASLGLPWMIEVKNRIEIDKMKKSGELARQVLDLAGRAVYPGVTTDEIDQLVHETIIKAGAYPSPLNYHGFPKSCCTSVNEVICHGIPDDRPLQKGDLVNLDITVYLDGYHGDCSEMFVVGGEDAADPDAKKLLQATYDCWISACNYVKAGRHYKDLGAIIEDYVTPLGLSTVRNFCGHGIGSTFHTHPNILHYRNSEPNGVMTVGHTFTIEPMICEGTSRALTWPDNWTATTADGKRSAQFEHTLLITPDGVEALTGKSEASPLQFWERDSTVHRGVWLGTSEHARKRMEEINRILLPSSSTSSSTPTSAAAMGD